jgi:hypothetical protein
MSRQGQANASNTYNQAQDVFNTAGNVENTANTNASNIYNSLYGQYQNEAANPAGFTPAEKATMTTGAEQSAGGSLGAATGKAAQYAAANKNSGSFAPVLDEASRAASRNLSGNTLAINNEDTALKEKQRQAGLSGLSGLEGMENNDVFNSIGLQNSALNTQTNANNSFVEAGKNGWFQNMLALMNTMKLSGGSGSSNGGDPTDDPDASGLTAAMAG